MKRMTYCLTGTLLILSALMLTGFFAEEAESQLSTKVLPATATKFPVIRNFGAITPYPDAVEQPREGTKIVVDMTKSGSRKEISKAIQKVARFVNIYSSAGKTSAGVKIAVVLHGDATQLVLKDEVYAEQFGTEKNPNLPLMRTLKDAGVEFLVCGQALNIKGFNQTQVDSSVQVAVSGLTAMANRQSDGYTYFPLLK